MADLGLKEIIGIVLALTFLVIGLGLIRSSMSKSNGMVESEMDARTSENLENMLKAKLETEILAVSSTDLRLARGKESTFLIGVKNAEPSVSELSIVIVNSSGRVSADEIFLYKKDAVSFKEMESQILISKVMIPDDMPDGSYIFDVNLMKGDERLKSKQIVVKVG